MSIVTDADDDIVILEIDRCVDYLTVAAVLCGIVKQVQKHLL